MFRILEILSFHPCSFVSIISDHHKDVRPKSRDQSTTETQTQPFSLDRSHTFPFTNISPPHGFYGHAFGATPFMPYPGGHLGYPNPLLNSTSMFQHSSFRPSSAPVLNSSFNASRLEVPQMVPTFSTQLHSSSTQQDDSKESSPSKPEPQGFVGANSSARSGRLLDSGLGSYTPTPRSMMLPQHGSMGAAGTSLLPDPFMVPMSSRLPVDHSFGAEQNKQLASLLGELDAQREECRKVLSNN